MTGCNATNEPLPREEGSSVERQGGMNKEQLRKHELEGMGNEKPQPETENNLIASDTATEARTSLSDTSTRQREDDIEGAVPSLESEPEANAATSDTLDCSHNRAKGGNEGMERTKSDARTNPLENLANTAAAEPFEPDASKYPIEALLAWKQQKNPNFWRLTFVHLGQNYATLERLFPILPTKGDLFPPKEKQVNAKLMMEWRNMTKDQQMRYKYRNKVDMERQKRSEKRTGKKLTSPVSNDGVDLKSGILAAKLARAPPLSHPIAYFTNSKKLDSVRLFYQEIPNGLDWTDGWAIEKAFPPQKGYGWNKVPQCLLLDAKSPADKLTIVNWWCFLNRDQRKAEIEQLRNIYATPKVSNRLLPADYFEKMAAYDRKMANPTVKKVSVDPTGNDFYVRRKKKAEPKPPVEKHMSCRGWTGEKFDQLFRACYVEALNSIAMKGGARIFECIPVPKTISQAKATKNLVFVREGEDYVLRSVGCTNKREQNRYFCENCTAVSSAVHHVRTLPLQQREQKNAEKKQESLSKMRINLRRALRREERLRTKVEKLKRKQQEVAGVPSEDEDEGGDDAIDVDENDEPSPKRQRAAQSFAAYLPANPHQDYATLHTNDHAYY